MIISASRRTDIPAFYSAWLMRRIAEGYALLRNPMNYHQVSRVNLIPDAVDCLVFWSKNPAPLLLQLHKLHNYMYYFLFSLNAYGADMETNLPPLGQRIETFRRLAEALGPERVVWRYSPIVINAQYTSAWHADTFGQLARQLNGYTRKCVISFLNFYPKIKHSVVELQITEMNAAAKYNLAGELAQIALATGMLLDADACEKNLDLKPLGISSASCIDAGLITQLTGRPLNHRKDPGQPAKCNCAVSVDIGAYSTCANGCRYCYANSGVKVQPHKLAQYDVASPLLCSHLEPEDIVKDRQVVSSAKTGGGQIQLSLHK